MPRIITKDETSEKIADYIMHHIDAIKGKQGYWHIMDLTDCIIARGFKTLCGHRIDLIHRECSLEIGKESTLKLIDCPQCLKRYRRDRERLGKRVK